jgi:hypothetical protein
MQNLYNKSLLPSRTKDAHRNILKVLCINKFLFIYKSSFFTGNLKWIEKKGVSQCDVNLEFNTKKVLMKLFGYVRKSEASVSTNLRLDYKFPKEKTETVKIEAELSNRTIKSLFHVRGNLKLESTAYPQFNFTSFVNLFVSMTFLFNGSVP